MSIRALIFDWAGTTVDHGSLAPVLTLERVLAEAGVRVPREVIRRDMGLAKRDHITRLLWEPETVAAWQAAHGAAPPAEAVDSLYAAFLPLQMECLLTYSNVLPGVPEVMARFLLMDFRIGSTTGYTRAMLDALVKSAEQQGYSPEIAMSPEDVGAGRPSPAMCLEICHRFGVAPGECIKIGDTISDIDEGRNAGMWTIGITRTGNMVGLSQEEWHALPKEEHEPLLARAKATLLEAGAHATAQAVAQSISAIKAIATRADAGEQP